MSAVIIGVVRKCEMVRFCNALVPALYDETTNAALRAIVFRSVAFRRGSIEWTDVS